MNFQQRDAGDFRIYAMAFDSPQGGYVAGVEVRTIGSTSIPARSLYSNEFLANGFRFEAAADALRHALDTGHRLIRQGLGSTAGDGSGAPRRFSRRTRPTRARAHRNRPRPNRRARRPAAACTCRWSPGRQREDPLPGPIGRLTSQTSARRGSPSTFEPTPSRCMPGPPGAGAPRRHAVARQIERSPTPPWPEHPARSGRHRRCRPATGPRRPRRSRQTANRAPRWRGAGHPMPPSTSGHS